MKINLLIAIIFLNLFPYNYSLAQKITSNQEENQNLISPDSQVNYNLLNQYLSEQEWRKANDETRKLLLEATGRKSIGYIRTEDLETLSCWDLKLVDKLWQKHSQGKFGFSVQLPIYVGTGNRPGKLLSDENYNRFGDQVGWRENDNWIIFIENLNYTLNAPIGHLPNPRKEYSITGGRLYYSALSQRMTECNLGQ